MNPETDPLDDHLHAAGRRLRDATTVQVFLDDALAGVTDRNHRRPVGRMLVVAAAVVAMVIGVTQFRPADDVEVAVDDVTTTMPAPAPDAAAPPTPGAPLALGGATDGVDSVGLPITADPSTGLVDGQQITVTGSGFPPGESIGIVMCTREAARDHGAQGIAACNIGRYGSATSDADGVAVGTFQVSRVVVLGGVEVDCAEAEERCLIGMGMINDYDQSGGVLVSFDDSVPLPPRPTAEVSPTGGLRDGDEVQVTTSYTEDFGVQQCVTGTDQCWYHEQSYSPPEATVRVWRTFSVFDSTTDTPRNVDCAVEACELRIEGYSATNRLRPEPVPLTFDPDGPIRTAPAVTVSPATTVAPGSTISVSVDGERPFYASLCPSVPPQVEGDVLEDGTVAFENECRYVDSNGGTAELEVFEDPAYCGSDGCILHVEEISMGQSWLDQGPPVFIEPVRILLTDV